MSFFLHKLNSKQGYSIILLLKGDGFYVKKFKGFYRNNRNFVILMGLAGILLIFLLVIFLTYFIGQRRGSVYGNRLNGIEAVEMTKEKLGKVESAILAEPMVEKVNINLIGKIIYMNIYLKEGKVADAKNIGNKSLEAFTDDEKNFYDLSYIVHKEGDDVFPIMGSKKSDRAVISWTNVSG